MLVSNRRLLKLYCVCGLIGLSFNSIAQKIKKEAFGYFNYHEPRASLALDNATHYYLKVEISDEDLHRRKLIEDKLEINQFKKAGASDEYQFTIDIKEGDFKFSPSKRNSSSKKVTTNGVEKTVTEYYFTGTLGYHYTFKVLDKDGNEVYRELLTGNVGTKGRRSTSLSKAQKYYSYDKFEAKENVVNDFINRAGRLFNEHFTDIERSIQIKVPAILGKKYKYPEYDEGFKLLKSVYDKNNTSYQLDEESRKDLNKAIGLFDDLLKEADIENAKAKVNDKIAAALHFNIAIAQFMLGNYRESLKHFENAQSIKANILGSALNWVNVTKHINSKLDLR